MAWISGRRFIIAIIGIIMVVILTDVSLWLVDSSIVYPLVLFESAIIFLLYFVMGKYEFRGKLWVRKEAKGQEGTELDKISEVFTYQLEIPHGTRNEETGQVQSIKISGSHVTYKTEHRFLLNTNRGLEIIVLLIPAAMLLSKWMDFNNEIALIVLALASTSIIPGYSVLKLSSLGSRFSKLELLVFSVIASYLLTGLFWFTIQSMIPSFGPSLFLLFIATIGIAAIFKNPGDLKRRPSFSSSIDKLVVFSILAFFLFSWILLYPGFLMILNSDVVRHYASSIILARSPDLYLNYAYLLAHLHQSAYLSISNASFIASQIGLLSLNLALPLSFYIFSERTFNHIDRRIPIISTVFWVLFTPVYGGFSWIIYIIFKIINPGLVPIQIIQTTSNMTFNGNVYALYGLWYVPLTISLTMLFSALSLMRNQDLSKTSFTILFSSIIAGMFLTHVTEALFFVLFLAFYASLFKGNKFRINDSLESSIVGFLLVLFVYYILSLTLVRFIVTLAGIISISLPLGAVIIVTIIRKTKLHELILNLMSRLQQTLLRRNIQVGLQSLLFYCFGISAIVWYWNINDFHLSQVSSSGLVPWFMFPMLMGITGILSVLSIKPAFSRDKYRSILAFFVAFLLFAFIFGRALSFVNTAIMNTSYWEKRFLLFIKISLAVISPVWFIGIFDRLSRITEKPSDSRFGVFHMFKTTVRLSASWLIVAIVVIGGLSTSFLSVGYWNYTTTNALNQSAIDNAGVEQLQVIFNEDPYTWLYTPSLASDYVCTRAAPADLLGSKAILNTALTPEMALMLLYRQPIYSHPYIYVSENDQQLLSEYDDSFIGNHLTLIPQIYNSSQSAIYDSPKLSFPQVNSDTALVLPPTDYLGSYELLSSYYALSGGNIYYSTVSESDPSIWHYNTLVLPYDLPPAGELTERQYVHFSQDWNAVFGEWIVDSRSLVGGSPIGETAGLFTSSNEVESFHASFNVNTTQLNESVQNYAGLVYSYEDSTHMKIAELMFGTDGFIHAFISTVNNTHPVFGSANPAWPGINTGITWQNGTKYRISVDITENSTEISIDGTQVLMQSDDNQKGKIGFFYYRPSQIIFSNLVLETKSIPLTKSTDEFIEFIRDGGTLIILNTNGYGFFADELFQSETIPFEAKDLSGLNDIVEFPNILNIKANSLKTTSVDIIANYTSPQGNESVYITKENSGAGTLFYVNLFPLLNAVNETNKQQITSSVVMKALVFLNQPTLSDAFLSLDGYTKSITLENATIKTSSVIFPYSSNYFEVDLHTSESAITLSNIISIQIQSSQIGLTTTHVRMGNGLGFYANCSFDASLLLTPQALNQVTIFSNEEKLEFQNITSISVTPSSELSLLLKLPNVEAESATFENLYALSDSLSVFGQTGKTVIIQGVKFDIGISDVYTIFHHMRIFGDWFFESPENQFNELFTFIQGLEAGLMLLPTLPLIFWTLGGRFSLRRYGKSSKAIDKPTESK